MPVEALRKGLDLLEALCAAESASGAGTSLGDLAASLGLKRTTAHNLLKTLTLCGYAENTGEGRYRVGWRLARLARHVMLQDAASARFGETAAWMSAAAHGEAMVVTVLLHGRRRVVARAAGTQVIRVDADAVDHSQPGMWSTVTGRVLAAFCSSAELVEVVGREGSPSMDQWPAAASGLDAALVGIRSSGLAEDCRRGVASLAVPFLSPGGRLLGAVGTYLPEFRYGEPRRSELLEVLRQGARRLGDAVTEGSRPAPVSR